MSTCGEVKAVQEGLEAGRWGLWFIIGVFLGGLMVTTNGTVRRFNKNFRAHTVTFRRRDGVNFAAEL